MIIDSNVTADDGQSRSSPMSPGELGEVFVLIAMILAGNATNLPQICGRSTGNISRRAFLSWHLSLADLLLLWTFAFSQTCWLISGGQLFCPTVIFARSCALYASSNLVCVVAVERLYVTLNLHRPMNVRRRRQAVCRRLAVVAWTLALLCSLPQLYVWRTSTSRQCVTIWTPPDTVQTPPVDNVRFRVGDAHLRQDTVQWQLGNVHSDVAIQAMVDDVQPKMDSVHSQGNNLQLRTHDTDAQPDTVQYQDSRLQSVVPRAQPRVDSGQSRMVADQLRENSAQSASAVRSEVDSVQSKSRLQIIHTVVHLTLMFWLPAVFVLSCYAIILRRFSVVAAYTSSRKVVIVRTSTTERSRTYATRGQSDLEITQDSDDVAKRRKLSVALLTVSKARMNVVRQTVWILLTYLICWTPYNVQILLRLIKPTFGDCFLQIASNLILLNAVINPLLYGYCRRLKNRIR